MTIAEALDSVEGGATRRGTTTGPGWDRAVLEVLFGWVRVGTNGAKGGRGN